MGVRWSLTGGIAFTGTESESRGGHFAAISFAAAIASLALLVGLILLTPPVGAQPACTINWTSTDNGSWLNPANWDLERVPEETDHVCIPAISGDGTLVVSYSNSLLTTEVRSIRSEETLRIGAGTLHLTDPETTSHTRNLDHSSGELRGAGSIDISEHFFWGQGRQYGPGTTTVLPGAEMTIGGLPNGLHDGRILINQGIGTWTTGTMTLGQDVLLHNQGELNILLPNLVFMAGASNTSGQQVINDGVITKTGASLSVTVPTINNGTIDIEGGTLGITGAANAHESTGHITVAEGATLSLGGSSTTFHQHAGSSIQGNGEVSFFLGDSTMDGLFEVGHIDVNGWVTWSVPVTTGHLSLRGGGAIFEQPVAAGSLLISGSSHSLEQGFSVHPPTVSQTSGTIWINGDLNVVESFHWSSGNHRGPGTTRVMEGAALSLTPSPTTKTLGNDRSLENRGAGTWTGGLVSIQSGSTFHNTGEFVIDLSSNTYMLGPGTNPPGIFLNEGTVLKTGTGRADIRPLFTNLGTLDVLEGEFWQTLAPTNFSGNTLTDGTFMIRTEGTLRFPGADIVSNEAMIVLDGPDASIISHYDVDGLRNFAENTANGTIALRNGHHLTAPGGVTNHGLISIGQDSTLTAHDGYNQYGGETNLANGTLNAGNVDIQGGVLSGNGTVDGDVINAGIVSPGQSPGTIHVSGDYIQTPSGSFKVDIEGVTQGILYDHLSVSGTATLSGVLDLRLSDFLPSQEDEFVVMSHAARSGEFELIQLDPPGLHVLVDYQATQSIVTFSEPTPTWPDGSSLTATDIAADSVTLVWTPAEAEGGIAGYQLFQDGDLIAELDASVLTLDVTALTPDTEYEFSVRAGSVFGAWTDDGPSTIASTLPLPEPDNEDPEPAPLDWGPGNVLFPNAVRETEVALRWRQPKPHTEIAEYRIYQDGEYLTSVPSTNQGTLVLNVTGLTPGTTYEFSVFAYREDGERLTHGMAITVETKSERPGPPGRNR